MISKNNEALLSALAVLGGYETSDDSTRLIVAKCRALIVGYDRLYHDAGYIPTAVERTVQADLLNPETERTSRTFQTAGKLDVETVYTSRKILFDHKSTSQDIIDPAGPYWRQLCIEGQVSHYMLLAWQNGEKYDGAVWDVMHKPTISPKKITKAEVRSVVSSQTYFGRNMSEASVSDIAIDDRETLEMYEARLAHDCTAERPQYYFQRRAVPRMDSEILEYARELWEHGQEILHARNTGRHARNSGACLLYNSPCKFLGICSGHDSPDSGKWSYKAQVHRELPTLGGDGKSVLTNSRIRCFQTCRRKHYYEYELGIERIDEEEREALLFGHLWHLALEAWWSSFLPKEPIHGNCDESAGTELANCGDADETSVTG